MQEPPFLVAIGASIGGVEALLQIAAALPQRLNAVVCVVLHVGPNPSMLPELLGRDARLPLHEIAPHLVLLVGAPVPPPQAPPMRVTREYAINRGEHAVENLQHIASPSSLTCPDCGGTLWEVQPSRPLRYRCHTGHAFGARSLERAQAEVAEQSLWGGMRALHERAMLLRRMAGVTRATGDPRQADVAETQAAQLMLQAEQIAALAQSQTTEESTAGGA